MTFVVATAAYLLGATPFESQGYFGTLCSFGFLSAYILVSLAAPPISASSSNSTSALCWFPCSRSAS